MADAHGNMTHSLDNNMISMNRFTVFNNNNNSEYFTSPSLTNGLAENDFTSTNGSLRKAIKTEQISPIGSPRPDYSPVPVKNVRLSLPDSIPSQMANMVPSSRLSMGMTGRVQDLVAVFPQTEVTNPDKLLFQEKVNKKDRKVFTAKSSEPGIGPINLVGTEDKAGDGFEYVLAVVDRKTGMPLSFKRTALINFQPRFEMSMESLMSGKNERKSDYEANFESTTEQKRAERRRLTADFGSTKKNKFLDAKMRRNVTNETLEAMTSTAFSSDNLILNSDTKTGDTDGLESKMEKKISLLEQPTSTVLPSYNANAKVPGDVYSLDQFMPQMGAEYLKEMHEKAIQFFQQHDTPQKLHSLNIPQFVVKRLANPFRYGNPARRCCLSLKLIAFAKITKIIYKVKGGAIRNLSIKELDEINFIPLPIFEYIRQTYLGTSQHKRGQLFFALSAEQRNRILAELLCLMILFDDPDYILPISPLVHELGVPENTMKSLLVGMGCIVTVATETQALTLNTVRIARLIGPPERKTTLGGGKNRKRGRKTN